MKTTQKMPMPMLPMVEATEPTTEVMLPRSKVSLIQPMAYSWMEKSGSRLGKVVIIQMLKLSSMVPKPAEL